MSNNHKTLIDISWPISDQMVTYKDRGDVSIAQVKQFSTHQCRESILNCHVHTGTHIDAPAHFLADGATIDQIDLTKLNGLCQVLDLTKCASHIGAEDLNFELAAEVKIILFKTRNSLLPTTGSFDPNFIYLDAAAAQYLSKLDLSAVGIDSLGIERNQPGHPTHRTLLAKSILIIEGLRLAHVKPGTYQLACLPLNLINAEAAPARAILLHPTPTIR